jgi:hypothetical protein
MSVMAAPDPQYRIRRVDGLEWDLVIPVSAAGPVARRVARKRERMDLVSLLAVFGLGTVELWAAIPAGLVLQIHPVTTGAVAALGAILGILAMGFMGGRVRLWLLRRSGGDSGGRHGRIARFWVRYGVIGLGLLSPLLVGAPLGTAVGMSLGAPTGRLVFWMSLGAVLCSLVLTSAATLGLMGLESLIR